MTADFTWLGSLPLSLFVTLSENRLDLHPDASPGLAQPKGVVQTLRPGSDSSSTFTPRCLSLDKTLNWSLFPHL